MSLQDSYILFFSIITIVISFKLYKRASGSLSIYKLGPISISFYVLLFLSYIGTVVLALNKVNHPMLRYLRHGNIKTEAFFITSILMIVFPLVICGLNKLFKYNPSKYQEYRESEVKLEYKGNIEFITVLIASVVCISSIVYVFAKIGIADNPFFNIIRGEGAKELALLRMDIANKFTGVSGYIKNIFALALTPFISYIAYVYMRKKKKKKWIILFVVLFLFSNVMVFYNLQKASIIIYWGNFVVLSILYGDKIKLRYIIALGLISLILLFLMYIFIAKQGLDVLLSFENPIFKRIFITTPTGFFLHMEVFTYRMLKLNGASMPGLIASKIFGFNEVIRSSGVVMSAVNFEGVKSGTSGVYNGLFLGEAFANFGGLGMVIAMIHVPVVFFILNYVFTKIKKTPIYLALFSYLTVNLVWTLHGGYSDYIYNIVWIIVIAVAIAMSLFNKTLNKVIIKKREKVAQ